MSCKPTPAYVYMWNSSFIYLIHSHFTLHVLRSASLVIQGPSWNTTLWSLGMVGAAFLTHHWPKARRLDDSWDKHWTNFARNESHAYQGMWTTQEKVNVKWHRSRRSIFRNPNAPLWCFRPSGKRSRPSSSSKIGCRQGT